MEDEVEVTRRKVERGGVRNVPVCAGDDVRGRKLLGERGRELAAAAGDQDVLSRAERIGDDVLQRCFTRGSFNGTPCSSGSPGSYSSVTW